MNDVIKSLGSHFDRSTDTLWFSGEFATGAHFDVGFPIAHVAITFDSKMASLGFVADPVCGSIATIEGFEDNLEATCNCTNPKARDAARNALQATIGDLTGHALHYAAHGHDAVLGSFLSKIGSAVGSIAKTVEHVATAPEHAAINITTAAVTGKNIAKAVVQEGKNYAASVTAPVRSAVKVTKSVASGKNVGTLVTQAVQSKITEGRQTLRTIQSRASLVPGIGTVSSMAIGATEAGLSGKSLPEIVKAAGVSAVPGGPLAQQIAMAGINTVQAGVEGKNMLRAAAQQTINAVVGVIPDATARQLVQRVALDAAAGKNVLKATERAAVDTAINAIPDPTARDAARKAIEGYLAPASLLEEVARGIVNKSIASDGMLRMVSGSADNLRALGALGLQSLKTAAAELIEVSSNFVPDATARAKIQAAIKSSFEGKRPSQTAPLTTALNKVTDPNARNVLLKAIQGETDPEKLLTSAGGNYIATLVHLDPKSHIANAIVQGQNIVTGRSGITAPTRKAAVQSLTAPPEAIAIKIPRTRTTSSGRFPAIGAQGLSAWRTQLRG